MQAVQQAKSQMVASQASPPSETCGSSIFLAKHGNNLLSKVNSNLHGPFEICKHELVGPGSHLQAQALISCKRQISAQILVHYIAKSMIERPEMPLHQFESFLQIRFHQQDICTAWTLTQWRTRIIWTQDLPYLEEPPQINVT